MMSGLETLARVVVCEQDIAVLDRLCGRLAEDRYEPLPARAADEALRLCRHHVPDLLIADLDLPGDDGPELLRRIREAHWLRTRIDPHLAVLALRSRDKAPGDQDPDLVADDHLEKPFTYEDLRSRIETILRSRHGRLDDAVQVGELLVDPERREVMVGDRAVRVSRTEFTLLRILADDPTRVFTKEELLRDIWNLRRPPATTRTLDSHASRLRRKLDPDGRRYVVNCWGVGYKLLDSAGKAHPDTGPGRLPLHEDGDDAR